MDAITTEAVIRAAADIATTAALALKETPAGAQSKVDVAVAGKLDTAGSLELLNTYAYGHSYLSQGGTAAWPARVARRTGAVVANRGVGGEQLAQTVPVRMFNAGATGVAPGLTGIYVLDCMINDVRLYGTHAGSINDYKDLLRDAIGLCRAAALKHEVDASIAYTGTWASLAHSAFIGGSAKYSGTTGDYADITFSGDEITVFGMRSNGTAAGGRLDFLVPPSGPVLASQTQAGTATTSLSTGTVVPFNPVPVRLTGFGAGSHTLRVLVGLGTGLAFFDGYVTPMANPPTVVIVKDQVLPTWTGGSNVAPYDQGSDASIAAYKAAVDTVVAEFPAGQVLAVDPVTVWDKTTCLNADGVHPNDRGHSVYAAAIAAALLALPYRAGMNII
ncbi:MAG: hypothetical protein M3Y26_01315 [Actinomycetota bacterium]|nr:hypothetical protein [Actinomycetota bacterium]